MKVEILMNLHHSVNYHIGSHSVTFYPTQVNTSRLNPSYTPEGWKAELT